MGTADSYSSMVPPSALVPLPMMSLQGLPWAPFWMMKGSRKPVRGRPDGGWAIAASSRFVHSTRLSSSRAPHMSH